MTDAAADAARGFEVGLGEVTLWVDTQGPDDGETVLLVAGADSPGFRWTPAMVDPLVAEGYRVVRFDHRDCGRSTRFGPDAAYLLDDLAADAVGLLDHLGVESAHVVGRSMGAMVGQVLALDHPSRVRSLTMFGSSAGPGDDRLPGPADDFVETMTTRLFAGPPSDPAEQVAWIVELYELLAGSLYPVDAEQQHALAAAEVETGWAAETGHGVAVHASPSRIDRLGEIAVPTLVVHGTTDPVFAPEHGRVLAAGIPGAVLIEVDGLGHEVPDGLLHELMPVLVRHLAESSAWAGGGGAGTA